MAARIRQLDGLRGLAVLGVAWFHWAPPAWRGPLPFEIGLFFFFVASGYLVTAGLLSARAPAAGSPAPGERRRVYLAFLGRRLLRILAPYYVALVLAALLDAGDIRRSAGWYLLPLCNVHMAFTGAEPAGIAHFWTLAIQQQFYLLWPLLLLWLPRRALAPAITALVLVAPLWRMAGPQVFPQMADTSLLGFTALDYLGCGSLLAIARRRRPDGPLPGLRPLAWGAFGAYAILYAAWWSGHPVPGIRWFQQTFLAIACCGLIDATRTGLRGPAGRLFEAPLLLRAGAMSYSIYLLHNLSPLLTGWVAPVLWRAPFDSAAGTALRIAVFALVAWLLAAASWRWIERPVERLRGRLPRSARIRGDLSPRTLNSLGTERAPVHQSRSPQASDLTGRSGPGIGR